MPVRRVVTEATGWSAISPTTSLDPVGRPASRTVPGEVEVAATTASAVVATR